MPRDRGRALAGEIARAPRSWTTRWQDRPRSLRRAGLDPGAGEGEEGSALVGVGKGALGDDQRPKPRRPEPNQSAGLLELDESLPAILRLELRRFDGDDRIVYGDRKLIVARRFAAPFGLRPLIGALDFPLMQPFSGKERGDAEQKGDL